MKRIGLWIDHKKAVLVVQDGKNEDIQQIESGVGRHLSYRGASNSKSPYSAQYQQGDNQLDNKYTEYLKKFYSKVIAQVQDADAVFIFGPGEAKVEFEKRLLHDKANAQVVGIEAADKMTTAQIAAKVRKYFLEAK